MNRLDAKWQAFSAIALTYVTIVFATTMSFLVLNAISDEFDVTLGAVSWVVISESLIVGALLLPLGNLGDRLGRRRVLVVGMAVFGLGSVLTAVAPTFGLVIGARIITSIGNALVQSIATGLLIASFPDDERGLAMGAQTTAVAVGSTTGPLVTGLALDVLSWRTLFGLLAIPSALSIVLILRLIGPDDTSAARGRRIDLTSAALSAAAITLLTVTISNPFELAWTSPLILLGGLATIGCFVAYVRWELASAAPMLDLRLFVIRAFRTAVSVRFIGFLAATTFNLLLPILLISVLQVSGGVAGLVIACTAIGMGTSAQVSGRLYDRVGPAAPTHVGLAMQTAVFVALVFVDDGTSWVWLGLAALVQGTAQGLWNVPNNSAMIAAVPPASFGVGGAFTNVTRTVGNVFGQAIGAAIVAGVLRGQGFDIPLGDIEDTPGAAPSFVDGWRTTMIVAAAITAMLGVSAARIGWSDGDRRPKAAFTEA